MKKIVAVLTAVTVMTGLLLTGCGKSAQYDYNLDDYIKVGEYKGLKYEKPEEISVSDKEVQKAIKEDLEGAKYLKDVKDDKVHDGDTVNIDYKGTVDGKEFDGGTAEGQSLEIGSNTFIEGFESGLIGASVGDKVTLNLTFPKKYSNEDLAGKDVVFEVKINKSQKNVTPTEEYYVKQNTEYETVEKYEEAVKKELYDNKEAEQKQAIRDSLWDQIESSAEVKKYPEKEMNDYKERTKKSITDYAKNNNMEYADMIKQYYGVSEEDFDKQLAEAAKANCKDEMIVYYIAGKENLEVTDDEYKEFVDAQLKAMGYTKDQFKETTGTDYVDYVGGENYIRYYMLYTKVMDLVVENAKEK